MFFKNWYGKKLKMIWNVEKRGKQSYLAGTAHFFPHSFRSSLKRYIQGANHILFEGPLDQKSMTRVVQAGFQKKSTGHLFDELNSQTIRSISRAIAPATGNRMSFLFLSPYSLATENPAHSLVLGMKSWLAFFTIWARFLEKNGWIYSVDLEAYQVASKLNKKIIFLETVEEQIAVLERISHEKIIDFLNRVDQWPKYARQYASCYLAGDLENLKSFRIGFPSRHKSIIHRRDRIFYERMAAYLEEGNTMAFVGAPHVIGIRELLCADGYRIKRH